MVLANVLNDYDTRCVGQSLVVAVALGDGTARWFRMDHGLGEKLKLAWALHGNVRGELIVAATTEMVYNTVLCLCLKKGGVP